MNPESSPFMMPPNVVNGLGNPLQCDADSVFLSRIFTQLEALMREDFKRFTFVVHHWSFGDLPGRPIKLAPGGGNRILILTSDEREVFPVEEYQDYRLIFRAYGKHQDPASNVREFPVGYLNAAGSQDPVDFADRNTGIFFSGYLNRNRVDIYKQFHPLWWLQKRNLRSRYTKELARRAIERFHKKRIFDDAANDSHVRFTEWFGRGLSPIEYAKKLADTRIAICPPGFVTSETIRHWEAMRLGCIVISAPLPDSRFYQGSPIIQLNDWSRLKPELARLMADPDGMAALHEATRNWWNHACSEDAVADHMAKCIAESSAIG